MATAKELFKDIFNHKNIDPLTNPVEYNLYVGLIALAEDIENIKNSLSIITNYIAKK